MKLPIVVVLLVAAAALACTVCDADIGYFQPDPLGPHRKPPYNLQPDRPVYGRERPPYYEDRPPYYGDRPPHDRDGPPHQHVDFTDNYHGYEPKPTPYEKPSHERHGPADGSYHKPPSESHHG